MSTEDVKILGNYYSSFVLRVKIALNIKNVKYENIEENLMNKSERLLKANPIHQKVPVLIHGEKKHICESLIIVQYIDQVWSSTTAPSILPADPYDRAMARFWAAYLDDKLSMSTGVVKLLGTFNTFLVLRVKIALNIKSVNYEYVEENLMSKTKLLLKSNPVYKKIPVLIHDEKPVCESLIIVEYIDETWSSAPSILPSDPYDRAIARFWAAYVDDKLYPAFRELRTARGEEETAAVVNKMVEGFLLLEEAFVKCSKGKPFFGGESIGYLDIAFGCGLLWFNVVERMTNMKVLDETKMPNLVVWADKFCQHPAVKDVLPDVDKLMEFYRKMIPKEEVVTK